MASKEFEQAHRNDQQALNQFQSHIRQMELQLEKLRACEQEAKQRGLQLQEDNQSMSTMLQARHLLQATTSSTPTMFDLPLRHYY